MRSIYPVYSAVKNSVARSSIILLALLGSCATLSPTEKDYIDRVRNEPLSFVIPKDSVEAVKKRTLSFLLLNSDRRITTISDTALATSEPNDLLGEFAYDVRFAPFADSTNVQVRCYASSNMGFSLDSAADVDAHIASRFLRNGELPYPNLVSRKGHVVRYH